jgi:hypothetical protein
MSKSDTEHFAAIGRSVLLPGMEYMLEKMQEIVAGFGVAPAAAPAPTTNGRGWPVDPAERKAEARRRRMKGARRRAREAE